MIKIYNIDSNQKPIESTINDGTLNKAWYDVDELEKCLFKKAIFPLGRGSTVRVDWSEKIVEKIGNLLGLPVARYEYATAHLNNSKEPIEGILSVNCIPDDAQAKTGAEFLEETFEIDPSRQKYTIDNIFNALDKENVKTPNSWTKSIPGIDTAAKLFVGYLLADCLTQNEDRHGENWGVMQVGESLQLIPSYDHGFSLGNQYNSDNKADRLFSGNINESNFSHFKQNEGNGTVSILDAFKRAAELEPDAAMIWLERLVAIDLTAIDSAKMEEIFSVVPEERIDPIDAIFAKQLLVENQRQILRSMKAELSQFKSVDEVKQGINEIEHQDRLPDLDDPDPPTTPIRNPRRPPDSPDSTPSTNPNPTNSHNPSPSADSPAISTTTNRSPGNTTSSINLIELAQKMDRDIEEVLGKFKQRVDALQKQPIQPLVDTSLTEIQPLISTSKMSVTFSDSNNYRDYLKSKEYEQQLPPTERGDLGKKALEIVDPLMNQFRTIARAEAGGFLPAPHPYFRSFKTEMDLSEQDRLGIEKAREWAGRQPITPFKEERSRGLER